MIRNQPFLDFQPLDFSCYVRAAYRLYEYGCRKFQIDQNELGNKLRDYLKTKPNISFGPDADAHIITQEENLDARLLSFVDHTLVSIVAPITKNYFRDRPLYVVTVPKSGTHMMFELLAVWDIWRAGNRGENLIPGQWHVMLRDDTHSAANIVLGELAARPDQGKKHPLHRTPILFLYRHPYDIAISEMFYHCGTAQLAFAQYFRQLEKKDMLFDLIRGCPILGSLRERIRAYTPWLEMPNCIPVSYEELIGTKGGGSDSKRTCTLWSIQLKLHIPGSPEAYGKLIYNESTDTFRRGKIGDWKEWFESYHHEAAEDIDDLMIKFGYDKTSIYSYRRDEFRKRPLNCNFDDFGSNHKTTKTIEGLHTYKGHYIAYLRKRMYAILIDSQLPIEIAMEPDAPGMIVTINLDDLLRKIDLHPFGEEPLTPSDKPLEDVFLA